MNLQQRIQQMKKGYKDKRDLENYRANQQMYQNNDGNSLVGNVGSGLTIGRSLYDGIKSFKQPTEATGVIGDAIKSNIAGSGINNSPISNAISSNIAGGELGDSAISNAADAQIRGASGAAETTSKLGGATDKLGKAMPAVGAAMGVASAANKFANGQSVDGALDLAKTGAAFIPGVGWAVAGAIEIAQMVKSAREKAAQKEMAKAQEESAKSQQLSMQALEKNKQGLEQQRQENLANMQEQMQPLNSNQDLINDLISQYQNYNTEQGVPTGGAASAMPANYPQENAPALPYEGSAAQELAEGVNGANGAGVNNVNGNASKFQSIVNGLKALGGRIGEGITDFNAGYQDNAVHGFTEGDLFNQIKSNNNEVTPFQTLEGVMTGGANEIRKTIMNRLGELAGTGSRVMANPWTQAGIAALATKATGGDGADMLNNAYKYGTAKATSNFYNNKMNPGKAPNALQNYTKDDYAADALAKYRDIMSENNAKRVDYQAYVKKSKEFSDLLKYGMITPEQYTNAMSLLNDNFGNENYAVGVDNAQISNDTRRTNETGRHNRMTEGIQRQNANTNSKRLDETVRHNNVSEQQNQQKINNTVIANKQKAQQKAINSGDAVLGTTPDGRQVLVPIEEVANFRRNGGKI